MHNMELHEIRAINNKIRVMRVPGGWIYERVIKKISDTENEVLAVFVPYSEEFNVPTP